MTENNPAPSPPNQPPATATAASVGKFADFFDRVICINLDRRPDRWAQFTSNFQEHGWHFKQPERFAAIDGEKVPTPWGWTEGGGSWGCCASHRRVLEQAITDGVKCLLVLEDDAYLMPDSLPRMVKFLENLPDGWDQIMWGGQHIGNTIPVSEGVVRCTNTQRTHAYAVRGQYLRDLYAHWCSPKQKVHIDWTMGGDMHSLYKVYAPDPFCLGQEAGVSDISGSNNPRKNWQSSRKVEPVVLLRCPKAVMQRLRTRHNWHSGNWRDEATDIDRGLLDIYQLEPDTTKLRDWINLVGGEAEGMGGVLIVWHPEARAEHLQAATTRPVVEITADTVEEAVAKWGQHERY